MATLEIKDLHVEVEDKDKKSRKKILKGVNLSRHNDRQLIYLHYV